LFWIVRLYVVYDYLTKTLVRLSLLLCFSKVFSNVVMALLKYGLIN